MILSETRAFQIALDLVDIPIVAERLGVARATVDMWRYRQLLPESDFPQLAHPVWEWETIRQWAEDTKRLEG